MRFATTIGIVLGMLATASGPFGRNAWRFPAMCPRTKTDRATPVTAMTIFFPMVV